LRVVTSTVVVSAKTTSDASKANPFPPDPNSSQSTINTVAREILEAGGSALALACDVRDFENITTLVDETVRQLGSIDVLVYNSGAIWWSSVENTPMKRFQLMQRINPEGVCSTSTSKGHAWVVLTSCRPLWLNTSLLAPLEEAELESTYYCCIATNLFTLLPWQDGVCNGYAELNICGNETH
jgi:NAD(P)-dependent dehydrogenase (short-subunit alcohol dehydrogenase family)